MPWEMDEAEDSAYDISEEQEDLEVDQDVNKIQQKAMVYDQELGWVMPCHPLARPASDHWLKIIGLAHLVEVPGQKYDENPVFEHGTKRSDLRA